MHKGQIAGLVVSSVLASGVGYAVSGLAGSSSPHSKYWLVTSVGVPDGFNALITDGSSLFIGGLRLQGACQLASVNTRSLKLTTHTVGCDVPPPGEKFAVQYGRIGSLQNFWNCKPESAAVRLLSVDPVTHEDVIGRVIMRVSGTCSHDYPLTVYTSDSMWVYDSSAGPTGGTGAIAELSTTTGALETFATVPSMPAAVLAADDDGFYIGPGEFYQPGQGIYHVVPGASRAQFLRSVPGPMAWLFGVDHSMYAALQHDYADPCANHDCQLWRFEGPRASPSLVSEHLVPGDELLVNAPKGDASVGILVTRPQPPTYADSFDVAQIDPSTGSTRVLAHAPVSKYQFVESSAYVSGAFYALVEGRLFRISP